MQNRVGKMPLAAGAGSNLQRLSDRGEEPKEGRARRVWRMSPYEQGTGSNVLGGGGPRLPMGGNTDCGQRDSGYLAVSTSAWVAGLIKPVQSPDAVLETRLWANHGVRVYANQRLSLGKEGKAYGGKAKTSNRTGEIPPSGIIGSLGKRDVGGNVQPPRNRKGGTGNPPLQRWRVRALSQPQRKPGANRLNLGAPRQSGRRRRRSRRIPFCQR